MHYRYIDLNLPKPIYDAAVALMEEARKYGLWRKGDDLQLFLIECATTGMDVLSRKILAAKAPSIVIPGLENENNQRAVPSHRRV